MLKSLSKITPRLRTLSDGDISLSCNLTGKWLESLCLCCFVPIIRIIAVAGPYSKMIQSGIRIWTQYFTKINHCNDNMLYDVTCAS